MGDGERSLSLHLGQTPLRRWKYSLFAVGRFRPHFLRDCRTHGQPTDGSTSLFRIETSRAAASPLSPDRGSTRFVIDCECSIAVSCSVLCLSKEIQLYRTLAFFDAHRSPNLLTNSLSISVSVLTEVCICLDDGNRQKRTHIRLPIFIAAVSLANNVNSCIDDYSFGPATKNKWRVGARGR